jgi:D-glycero-alpha-D-manno-heptose 1-phosphate guanylyltransferase
MIKEAIILAGGLGTRLQAVVADVPKCMAPVNGIPFIDFVITYLKGEGITRFIFSLGYKNEIVIGHLNFAWKDIDKVFVIEEEPLGTGGAIKKACEVVNDEHVVIVNGDTIFNINLTTLEEEHQFKHAECTIALAELSNFDRYGTVSFNEMGTVTAFHEKQFCKTGFINGGIYILNKKKFLLRLLPEKFSFEKNYLESFTGSGIFNAQHYYSYFIDIGVPEDYEAFQQKYSNSIPTNKIQSSNNDFGIILESIGAFFELLD